MFLKNILSEVGEDEPPSSDEVYRSTRDYYQHGFRGLCLRYLVGLPLHGRAVAVRYSLSCAGNTAR